MLQRYKSAFVSILAAAMPAIVATPAVAHPGGGHAHMTPAELLRHYTEAPDHLVFFGLAAVIGIAAFGIGRRIEAKAKLAARRSKSLEQRR